MNETVDNNLLRETFYKALELPETERQNYLDQLARNQSALAEEVLELIRAHEESEGFLKPFVHQQKQLKDLIRLERYQLIDKIGEGGAAQVFLARQEEPVEREVAVKILKTISLASEQARRFHIECQALAMMNHPHIAQIYDSGFTEAGMGFYAMEFVSGMPITDYCRHHRLNLQDRLNLFLKVCAGVSHAHQRLIIHRDLKPANILVHHESGLPKIIDFGIAKHLDHGEHTHQGAFMGTPPYMSPEQVRGNTDEYGTHTDVYALGALLYVLVAGVPPFFERMRRNSSIPEVMELIERQAPLKPSKALNDPNNRNQKNEIRMPGKEVRELDWLILQALAKEPGERYGSVAELAADVQRFLDNKPLVACPPKQGYLLRKFYERYRRPILLFIMALLVLTAGVVMLFRENIRAKRAEARAIRFAEALDETLSGADPRFFDPGTTVREFFDFQIDALPQSEPDVRHHLLTTFGRTQMGLGNHSRALSLLETAYKLGQTHPEINRINQLETGYHLATAKMKAELFEEAEQLLQEIEREQTHLLGKDHEDTLKTRRALLDLFRIIGRFDNLGHGYDQVLEGQIELLGENNPEALLTIINAAHFFHDKQQSGKAEDLYRRAVKGWQKIRGDHPYTYNAMTSLANHLRYMGKLSEARIYAEQALAGYRTTLGNEHPFTLDGMNNLAIILAVSWRLSEAEALYQEALELRKKNSGTDHDDTLKLMNNLASLFNQQGRYDEAIILKQEEIGLYRTKYGSEDWRAFYTQLTLAESYLGSNRCDQAIICLYGLASVFEQYEHLHAESYMVHGFLGAALMEEQRYEEAVFFLGKAVGEQKLSGFEDVLSECRERQVLWNKWVGSGIK